VSRSRVQTLKCFDLSQTYLAGEAAAGHKTRARGLDREYPHQRRPRAPILPGPAMRGFNAIVTASALWGMALAPSLEAGQGVSGCFTPCPTGTFIENPAGDSVVTITDTSGSVARSKR